jgi:hypothetical protein
MDVDNQINNLPGLACLNYASAIRPIVDNLPSFLRFKWEKKVVSYAEENNDDYPGFHTFAVMIQKQARLKNHPNVSAGGTNPDNTKNNEKRGNNERDAKKLTRKTAIRTTEQNKRNIVTITTVTDTNYRIVKHSRQRSSKKKWNG